MNSFTFSSIPHIHFGTGAIKGVGEITCHFGNIVLLVTGGNSLMRSGRWDEIVALLEEKKVRQIYHVKVYEEPSPALVDETVERYKDEAIDVVLAVGGGSVVDFGKVMSAMLATVSGDAQKDTPPIKNRENNISVENFLEGVGDRQHDGRKLPFIAVPTTSGTGSEATENAVLSRVGEGGFKKSIRHYNFVPNAAIVDPELTVSCPADVTAACAMDAFSQLLESYVSTKSNPMTDALAVSGLKEVSKSLLVISTTSPGDVNARAGMAYAALVSGMTLANAGLGLVHGFASPIGGLFNIPHGVICANVLGPAMKMTVKTLKEGVKVKGDDGLNGLIGEGKALKKFATVGAMFEGRDYVKDVDIDYFSDLLIEKIYEWTKLLKIPSLCEFGVTESDIERIVQGAGNKNNPIEHSQEEMGEILRECF